MSTRHAIVIVASTRAAAGIYADRSGPILAEFLATHGVDADVRVVADADVAKEIEAALAETPAVLLTSGGTGITADDRTIEALRPHLDLELPGIAHAFYAKGSASLATAVLSRTIAGIVAGRTFAMALPGSTGAAKDGAAVLAPLLEHILNQMEGNHDH